MSRQLTDDDVRDTNTYNQDDESVRNNDAALTYHLINTLDQDITYEFLGSSQGTDFTNANSMTNGTKTLAQGDTAVETLINTSYDAIRIEYSAASSPSTGSFVIRRTSKGM